jgi:hypothetical protein
VGISHDNDEHFSMTKIMRTHSNKLCKRAETKYAHHWILLWMMGIDKRYTNKTEKPT